VDASAQLDLRYHVPRRRLARVPAELNALSASISWSSIPICSSIQASLSRPFLGVHLGMYVPRHVCTSVPLISLPHHSRRGRQAALGPPEGGMGGESAYPSLAFVLVSRLEGEGGRRA